MCVAKIHDDSAVGKINSKIDPFGAYLTTGKSSKMDPLRLKKIGQVDIPDPAPPLQESKEPDTMSARRLRRNSKMANGTLLTGASGIQPGLISTGGSTLLGG